MSGSDKDKKLGRRTKPNDFSYKMGEQQFQMVLQGWLASRNFTVAISAPDTGEDIWLGEAVDKSADKHQRIIYRGQVKSLHSFEQYKKNQKRVFDANDVGATFMYTLSQPFFVYFVGIRDERLEQSKGIPFHVGCLPMWGFFDDLFTKGLINVVKNRVWLQFIVECPSEKDPNDYHFTLHIRNAGNFDVTRYFHDPILGLKQASGKAEERGFGKKPQ